MNKLKIKSCECCGAAVEKFNAFRNGNRLMVGKNGNLRLSFYKKHNPERKLFNVNLDADVECSVADIIIGIAVAVAALSVISNIMKFVCSIRNNAE